MAAVIDGRSSDDAILGVLHAAADAVRDVLDANEDWSLSGERATQYAVDLRADDGVLERIRQVGSHGTSILPRGQDRTCPVRTARRDMVL